MQTKDGQIRKVTGLVLCFFAAVFVAGCGGGGSTNPPPTPTPTPTPTPAPSIASVSPNVVTAGGSGFTLTVNGANFISSSVVQWNGSARTTSVVSATQLQGSITAADVAAGANNTVTVANPAGQGGVSAGFPLTVNNPLPTVSSLSPSALAAGGPAFTLTVTGTNFVPTSVVQFAGAARPTTFVSSTTLQASIPSADISNVGLSSVTVFNPTPAGGTSGKLTFTAAFPPPRIKFLTPGSAVRGGGDFTVTVTGTNFVPSSVVNFNGSPRATNFVSSTQLQATITAADISAVGVANVTVVNVVTHVSTAANAGIDPTTSSPFTFFTGNTGGPGFAQVNINQTTQDIVYDSSQQLIYASVPSTASTNPNTISILSLATAAITSSKGAGTNPDVLAISDDNQFLYAGIDGSASVQRFTLPGLGTDISYPLGSDFFGPFFALDLQAAPGAPHTTAVSRGSVGVSPRGQGGIVIFDDATPRPTIAKGFDSGGGLYDSLQWGADASSILAANLDDSGSDFYRLSVNASGVSLTQDISTVGSGTIHFDHGTNLIYGNNGRAIDPATGLSAGVFAASGLVVPDSGLNVVFVLTLASGNTVTIQSFDMTHFTLVGSITVPNVNGQPRRLIRWGQNGLAFNTDSGQVVLVGGSFLTPVPATFPAPNPLPTPPPTPAPNAPVISLLSPSSAIAGGSSFTLTVTGTNFDPAAVVQFNGAPLTTTFNSSTQLQAAVPAGNIASSGTAIITVANPVASGGVSAGSTFFIGTSGGSNFAVSVINQSANDLVFDPLHQVILLSVPSTAAAHGNTISALDPGSETIISSQFAGSEPGVLALSDDSQFLYAGINGAAKVQRFALPSLGTDVSYTLGSGGFGVGSNVPEDLQVAPGSPHTTAVTTQSGTITVFDDATPRAARGSGGTSIQWGTDATTLFTSGGFGADLLTFSAAAGGLTQTNDFRLEIGGRIHFDRGGHLLWAENGHVVNPVAGSPVAILGASGLTVPDSTLNVVFVLNQSFGAGVTLSAYDMTHFALVGSINIPNVNGTARRLIRWGQNGLAFNTDSGQVVLVGGNFVSAVPATFPAPNPLPPPPPTPAPNAPVISLLTPSSAIAGGSAFTLTVSGTNFDPAATVQFNGAVRTTTFVSSTQLTAAINQADITSSGTAIITVANPNASGGVSAGSTFFIGAKGGSNFAVSVIQQSANDLVFDPLHQVILLSVPSTAAAHGNTISALDPASETIISSQFAGSQPGVLALSDNSQLLYAGIDGSASVQRFSLPALSTDVSYPLGSDSLFGPFFTLDLQAAPGAPHTSAVSRGIRGSSPSALGGIVIFDDATPRPTIAKGFGPGGGGGVIYDSLQWGPDATSVLAANLEDSGADFYRLSVDPSGISLTQDISSVGSGRIHFDRGNNLVYGDNGRALDPATGLPAGTFKTFGLMVPDSGLNTAFFLNQPFASSSVTIQSYDMTHFTPVGSITIANVNGNARRLIRWGQNGLAFNTDNGQVVLVGGSFLAPVPATFPAPNPLPTPPPTPAPNAPVISLLSPSSAIAGGSSFTLTVTGTNFDPAAAVQFNGAPLTTTFNSSTQLQAAVPAGNIASSGTAIITVANPVASGGVSAGSTFFIGTSGGSNFAVSVINQSANDLVFDPLHQVILLSVPSTAAAHGNTISALDPGSETIISSQFAGSEPGVLALSDDSQFLYAGINGAAKVQRFTLPSLGTDVSYTLGSGVFGVGSNFADDIQVAPGSPHTTAVTTQSGTITVFDDATPRAGTGSGGTSIQWGVDATTVFSPDRFGSDLFTFSAAAGGLTRTNDFQDGISGRIHFDRGNHLLWAENGHVVDPVAGSPVAVLAASGLTVPDSSLNLAFVLNQPSGPTSVTLNAFDMTHFTLVGSITIPNVNGNARRLIRWGQNGLAFITDNGQVFLVGGNFVSAVPATTPSPTPLPAPPPTPAPNAPVISLLSPSSALAGGTDFTITVNGTNFDPAATVQFNGTGRATTFVSSTQLTAAINHADIASARTAFITVANPVANGGTSASSTFFIGSTAGSNFAVSVINQASNDLVFDSLHQVILLSVPGAAASHGNTISAIDLSGNVVSSQFAGSEPDVLALSGDSLFLYAGIDGASRVQRFVLPNFTVDTAYTLPETFLGLATAQDLQVAPGAPHTTAVVNSQSNPVGQIMIFDDATQRTNTVAGGNSIQWGADTSTVFSSRFTGGDLLSLAVTGSGLSVSQDFPSILSGRRIHFDALTSRIYADGGAVVDPATGLPVATFQASGLMVVDPTLNAAYVLEQPFNAGNATIDSFDLTRFVKTGSITISGVGGTAHRLIRWGQNGLAFNTSDGHLFLIGGNFVSPTSTTLPPATPLPTPPPPTPPGQTTPTIASLSPGSAAKGGADLSLTVNGTNFTASSSVTFNGASLTTTFVSAQQLTATVPAADIASGGATQVTVTDPSNGTSNPASFFVGAAAGTGTGGTTFASTVISQASNDLIFDPVHQVFLISVPSTGGTLGNTVTALDLSGNILSSQFAGSDPGALGVSDDGQLLYAGLNGASRAQRFTLPSFSPDINYSLGTGLAAALDLQVAPGAGHTAAYATGSPTSPFPTDGTVVFDDATQRTNRAFTEASSIQWGAGNTTLLGADTFGRDLLIMAADANGVTGKSDFFPFTNTTRIRFNSATGLVYGNDGKVVDPATGNVQGSYAVGSFASTNLMIPDSGLGKAFFLTQAQNAGHTTVTIQSFSLTTFTLTNSMTIANLNGTVQSLVRWGTNGLAFNTNQGQIVLLGGSFVN